MVPPFGPRERCGPHSGDGTRKHPRPSACVNEAIIAMTGLAPAIPAPINNLGPFSIAQNLSSRVQNRYSG